MFFRKAASIDMSNQLLQLVQRLSLGSDAGKMQVIAFIAARPREGTSTIASGYAKRLSVETGQRILLIDAGARNERARRQEVSEAPGLVDVAVEGRPLMEASESVEANLTRVRWMTRDENRGNVGKVIHDTDFWTTLRDAFETIVIDAPSLQDTFDGVTLATKADATILVVEAEKTPEPVVRNLRDTLVGAGVKVAGTVMNKRRFYIPKRVYRKL